MSLLRFKKGYESRSALYISAYASMIKGVLLERKSLKNIFKLMVKLFWGSGELNVVKHTLGPNRPRCSEQQYEHSGILRLQKTPDSNTGHRAMHKGN